MHDASTSPMQRREFLTSVGKVVLLIPAGIAIGGCGSTTTDDSTDQGFTVTSAVTNGHLHSITIPFGDISNPPNQGMSYLTTITNTHQHTVVLTEAQLTSVAEGAVVTVSSSIVEGHNHGFSIAKP